VGGAILGLCTFWFLALVLVMGGKPSGAGVDIVGIIVFSVIFAGAGGYLIGWLRWALQKAGSLSGSLKKASIEATTKKLIQGIVTEAEVTLRINPRLSLIEALNEVNNKRSTHFPDEENITTDLYSLFSIMVWKAYLYERAYDPESPSREHQAIVTKIAHDYIDMVLSKTKDDFEALTAKPGRTPAAEGRSHTEWLKGMSALEGAKDWPGLLEWCLKWTKSEPEDAEAWYSLGLAYIHLNRHNEAVEAYRQAIRIDPNHAFAWNNLGVIYKNLNRFNDAIEAYRQAIRIDPENAAWYNLGGAYKELNRFNDAIEAYRQAIRIDPENAAVWNNLGAVYVDLNRHNEAVEAYRQAIRIDPNHAFAWYGLGCAYGELNRFNDAVEAYCQAVRIDPRNAEAWYGLGVAYSLSGDMTGALVAVGELRRFDPARADELFNLIGPLGG
jgi:cytochrome c-type biogenesis protein CcmH/NrfG